MAGSLKELSQYRFDRSLEELENAKAMFEIGKYKSSYSLSVTTCALREY